MISHNEIEELEKHILCVDCIGEQFLKAMLNEQGKIGDCHYCGIRRKVTTIGEIADEIHWAFERHYQRTADQPSDFENLMIQDTGGIWCREGEPIVYAIAEASQIEKNVAEDIQKVLEYHHGDRTAEKVGEEGPYDEDAYYDVRELDDFEYRESWTNFENNLKTEFRFFSVMAKDTLDHIFEDLTKYDSPEDKPVIVEAGPGTDMTTLYRARVFQTKDQLKEALERPEVNLGPPPATLAKAGRMNAHGIGVFYGATESEIAISEVRPPVGSWVVVGRFELMRKVRLLDVGALRSVYVEGSIFDPTFISRLERAKFLRRLSERIAQPVTPDDEPLEYLVTQVIADFLAGNSMPEVDGMIYPSIQDSSGDANVVLFHKAARVESVVFAKGTKFGVHFSPETDKDWGGLYFIFEESSPSKSEDSEVVNSNYLAVDKNDPREPTLRLDVKKLTIHDVIRAKYKTNSHDVWVTDAH